MPNALAPRTVGARSRIEGTLTRTLPADVTILPGDPAVSEDVLFRLLISFSSEIPYLRDTWWDGSWVEVLGHGANEVDLSRLNARAAVLANHDRRTAVGNTPLAGIGAVERAWLQDGRSMAEIAISRREALADLRQDIADGLVTQVSVGYQINERILVKSTEGQPDEYRVTSWTPFEISLVDIAADPTVGLGRSAGPAPTESNQTPATQYRVIDLPAAGTTSGERTMPNTTQAPAATPAAPVEATRSAADYATAERARITEITATARAFPQVAQVEQMAERAIEAGTTVEAFSAELTRHLRTTGTLRPADSPDIGMSRREVEQFSFVRAMLAAADPAQARAIAPFEFECSRAAQDRRGDSRTAGRETAITIPVDVLSRGLQVDASQAGAIASMLIQRAQQGNHEAYRDLVVGTSTAGGNLVATQLLGSSFIELLRNALVLAQMGATMLTDLNGNIAIPSQTGGATAYWVAESGAPTESQQTVGQVPFTPKTVGAFTDYSRRLLLQSSISIEAFVRADLAATLAQAIQTAAINGSGASNEPTGILNLSGIGAVAGGTNGAAPTYDHIVDLETAVSIANADAGNLAYLTNSKVRGKLRKTQEFASTNGKAVWTRGRESGIGDLLGYDAYVSNSVPANLTKGSASGICSAIAYGNWADLIIAMWGGLDIMLDPYTGATSGTKRVVALQDLDIGARRVASFAAMKDALTT